ncbi:Matrilin-2 [Biomphalaria glabrata]|nr:cartilage matrix protein isoform X2 [Biomphalaria glabrata]KAI8777858.1 cartilage matrix protein isoform X2 [Biomphalaria glabrata]
MASSILFVISVVLLGQAFGQSFEYNYADPDYDQFRPTAERDPPQVRPLVERPPQPERDQTIEGCLNKKMDIYFVLDSSTSIYVLDYRRQLQFARDVVARLDINPSSTRVGLLTFSDQVNERPIELNRYTNKGDLLLNIKEDILPYRTGITNTDLAIRYVRENRDFRQDITKVIVVITDGGSRSPGQTAREAELAREQGFYLFVIGVGQYQEPAEWQSIASDPDSNFIYNLTNFLNLEVVKATLPSRACSLPPLLVGNCRVSNLNYGSIFYVATGRVLDNAYQLSNNFVARTSGDSSNIHVSYILDNCDTPTAENAFFASPEQYCSRYSAGSNSPLSELLTRAESATITNRQDFGDNNQVVVLFLDDDSLRFNSDQIRSKLQSFEAQGVEIIVVDISRRGVGTALQNLILRRENYIRFSGSITGQDQLHRSLIERTCTALTRPIEEGTPEEV